MKQKIIKIKIKIKLFFGLTLWHVRISVPQPGIKPTSPALKMQSLNHRPPGKSSTTNYFKLHVIQLFLSLYKKGKQETSLVIQ